jgi:hypothetical protein
LAKKKAAMDDTFDFCEAAKPQNWTISQIGKEEHITTQYE